MKISDARKGLRVQLTAKARKPLTFPDGSMAFPRYRGTLTSGRVLRQKPGYEEGLYVRVMWDGMRAPESWSLVDLEPHWLNEILDAARSA